MSRFLQKFRSAGEGAADALPAPVFPDGLKELYRPKSPAVDICLVHGLTGDREKTWTANGQSASWPETLLPGVLPNARILTFGYDAYIVKKGVTGTNGLSGHATNLLHDLTRDRTRCDATARPLIFVVHSLGGLVCKTALLASRDSPEEHLRDVFNSVLGVAFIGTPHRGAWMASWAKIPVTSLGFFKAKNSKLLDVLRTDNQFLEYVRTAFTRMLVQRKQIARAIEVACFYEEQPLPVVGLVVSKDSATMDDSLPFSIPANHMNMVRFASEADPGFDRLLGELQRWTRTLGNAATLPPEMNGPASGNAVTLSPEMARVRQDCLSSLHFSDMDMRSGDVRMATAGTCDWLLAHEQYRKWIEGQGLLLIKGKPGSGKSTLLKYAWLHTDTGDDLSLSFFFHGRGSALQNTPMGFLRSLAHQLLSAAPFTITDLIDAYQKNRTRKSGDAEIDASAWVWMEQDLQGYLMVALPKVLATRPVWLFVDALDESSEPNDLFRWLQGLLHKARSGNRFPCRFFASCRPFPVLLVKDGAFTICTEDENARDIAAYVNGRLQDDDISADIRDSDIPGLVVERASGIFLWAHWVMEEILSADLCGKPVSAVRSIVEGTPDTLAALYARQIEAMKDDQDCLDLMCWVCFAKRPLMLDELRWFIAMNGACKHESLRACEDAGDVLPLDKMARHVHSVSRGLLELSSGWAGYFNAPVIQFIHQTTKEFMYNTGWPALLGAVMLPAEAQRVAHFRLAKACVRYLAMEDFDTQNCWVYCTSSWLHHIETCNSNRDLNADEQKELLSVFRWPSIDLIAKIRPAGKGHPYYPFPSLVHALASRGLSGLLATVMQQERAKAQVNTRDDEDETPLVLAVHCGSDSAVRILLENGADVHAADRLGRTPLSLATRGGHDSVVRILLDNGADVHVADRLGRTPLSLAVNRGLDSMVRILLDYGADVHVADRRGHTPLLLAAQEGHDRVVRILVDHGADVHVADRRGRTPLLLAAQEGYDRVVRTLLKNGANVHVADEDGDTPLLLAAQEGYDRVVRTLLKNGADVHVADEHGHTPLLLAAQGGHDSVVRILLENGADVHVADEHGHTPLLLAAQEGCDSVVGILVDHSADIHHADRRGRTPLLVATESVQRILLEVDCTEG